VPKLTTVYWRDIPAQVIARDGRAHFKQELSSRFLRAIDRAAMRAGRSSSEAYLSEWRRVSFSCGTDLEVALRDQVVTLEAAFSDEVLESLVMGGGRSAA
jgi:hypothetical protein